MTKTTEAKKHDMKFTGLKALQSIPGVGKSIAEDLWNIGISEVADLKGKSPEKMYAQSMIRRNSNGGIGRIDHDVLSSTDL